MANSVDPDQSRNNLIWVCTVCPGIAVRKHRIITGYSVTFIVTSFTIVLNSQTFGTLFVLSHLYMHYILNKTKETSHAYSLHFFSEPKYHLHYFPYEKNIHRLIRRYFCCGSLLSFVLAVRSYTLVHLLCE